MSLQTTPTNRQALALKHEINVTPFIDVMLVLLIIFMVAAPLATRQMPVDLPDLSAPALQTPDEPITLWITNEGEWYINDTEVEKSALAAHLKQLTGTRVNTGEGTQTNPIDEQTRIDVRADKTTDFDQIMQAMDALSVAGYRKVGLIGADAGSAQ